MSDAMTFGEIDRQEVELLPARTVLSFYGGSYFDPGDYFDFDYDSSEATAFNYNENYNDITNTATGGDATSSSSVTGPLLPPAPAPVVAAPVTAPVTAPTP
jgi:hypothetical protein